MVPDLKKVLNISYFFVIMSLKQEAHGTHHSPEQQYCMIKKPEIIYYLCNINLLKKNYHDQNSVTYLLQGRMAMFVNKFYLCINFPSYLVDSIKVVIAF